MRTMNVKKKRKKQGHLDCFQKRNKRYAKNIKFMNDYSEIVDPRKTKAKESYIQILSLKKDELIIRVKIN